MTIIQDPSEKGAHNSQSNPNPIPMVLKPVHPKNKDSEYGNICNGLYFYGERFQCQTVGGVRVMCAREKTKEKKKIVKTWKPIQGSGAYPCAGSRERLRGVSGPGGAWEGR